ncbi:3-oxoadipate enol-lactonase [Pontibacter burrus]|uniref:3-oxoadipate enol-lactonase n=1 Tax=Pontibacter burrus TaxID=2704466 RepID=A0A6B3LVU1_9BACT|nr:3-oxoadipate enol-lactonase [Pontibacter burrus]NEM99085.1 3-oxoadipate enol-lactonase [Pontibacter burrus]
MSTIKLSNYTCFYNFQDSGMEDTLVLSNSLGTDYTMWDKLVELLGNDYNVLRYDTRGHGQSTIEADEVTIAELGQDVLELLDHLKLEKVYFCGLSMGGLIGQWLGIYAPQRFKKIILANTAAKIGTVEGWNNRIEQVKEHGLESILDGTEQRWFTPKFREEHPETVHAILQKFAQNPVRGYTANCAAVRDADFRNQLQDLRVPVLIISGLQDEVTTPADGEFMAARIPQARHECIDANHLSSVELPEAFAKNLLYFMKNEGDFYLKIYS